MNMKVSKEIKKLVIETFNTVMKALDGLCVSDKSLNELMASYVVSQNYLLRIQTEKSASRSPIILMKRRALFKTFTTYLRL